VDIGITGDSFGEGFAVPREVSTAGWLRSNGFQVCNVSRTGNGPLNELACLREYLTAKRPAVVLWFCFEMNDLSDLQKKLGVPALAAYLEPTHTQRLRERQPGIDRFLREYENRRFSPEALQQEEKQVRDAVVVGHPVVRWLWQVRHRIGRFLSPGTPPLP
jgi:hypothetical protein